MIKLQTENQISKSLSATKQNRSRSNPNIENHVKISLSSENLIVTSKSQPFNRSMAGGYRGKAKFPISTLNPALMLNAGRRIT